MDIEKIATKLDACEVELILDALIEHGGPAAIKSFCREALGCVVDTKGERDYYDERYEWVWRVLNDYGVERPDEQAACSGEVEDSLTELLQGKDRAITEAHDTIRCLKDQIAILQGEANDAANTRTALHDQIAYEQGRCSRQQRDHDSDCRDYECTIADLQSQLAQAKKQLDDLYNEKLKRQLRVAD